MKSKYYFCVNCCCEYAIKVDEDGKNTILTPEQDTNVIKQVFEDVVGKYEEFGISEKNYLQIKEHLEHVYDKKEEITIVSMEVE